LLAVESNENEKFLQLEWSKEKRETKTETFTLKKKTFSFFALSGLFVWTSFDR
jgi:hypothetical protein